MVAKNTPEEITAATTLSIGPINEPSVTASHIKTTYWPSLTQIRKLKGVGPATGSLVLSIYSPKYIPFFADELFEWITYGEDKKKLKYDLKEYDIVLAGVAAISEQSGGAMEARDIERVGYVMGHLDVLSEEEKGKILGGVEGQDRVGKSEKEESRDESREEPKSAVKGENEAGKVEKNNPKEGQKRNTDAGKVKKAKVAPKREASDALPDSSGTRWSKRTKR